LIAEGKEAGPKRRTFIFVNNRLEGNAPGTIAAMGNNIADRRWEIGVRGKGIKQKWEIRNGNTGKGENGDKRQRRVQGPK
jgi:hypothetical protein